MSKSQIHGGITFLAAIALPLATRAAGDVAS